MTPRRQRCGIGVMRRRAHPPAGAGTIKLEEATGLGRSHARGWSKRRHHLPSSTCATSKSPRPWSPPPPPAPPSWIGLVAYVRNDRPNPMRFVGALGTW